MAINYNEEEFGLQLPNQGGTTDVAFKSGSALDRQINKLNQLEQLGFPQPNLQNLKEMDMKQFQETGTPLSLPEDQYAMAISNYDQLFGPKTMTDANQSLYTGMMDQSGNPIMDDIDMQYTDESFNVQPQYRIRDQLKRDFLQGGLFRDAKQSLGQSKDALVEDFSGLQNIIGSGVDKMQEGLGFLRDKALSGWDSVSGGLKSLMDNTMLGRIAAMRDATNPRAGNYNPALQGQIDFMKEQGMYGNDWDQSGLNKITGGRLAGKNLQSLIGSNDLMDMYADDLAGLEKTLGNLPKQWSQLMKNNPAAYANKVKAFKEKIAQNKWEQEQARKDLEKRNKIRLGSHLVQDKNYRSDPELSRIGREKYTGKGMAFEKQKSGTFTTPSGKKGYSGGRKDGGRIGYSNGGLASLFTRRG